MWKTIYRSLNVIPNKVKENISAFSFFINTSNLWPLHSAACLSSSALSASGICPPPKQGEVWCGGLWVPQKFKFSWWTWPSAVTTAPTSPMLWSLATPSALLTSWTLTPWHELNDFIKNPGDDPWIQLSHWVAQLWRQVHKAELMSWRSELEFKIWEMGRNVTGDWVPLNYGWGYTPAPESQCAFMKNNGVGLGKDFFCKYPKGKNFCLRRW